MSVSKSKSKRVVVWGAVGQRGKALWARVAHGPGVRDAAARVKRWAAGSAWAPLAGKAAAYLLAFALLALVGSGRLSRWMTPPERLGIGVAEAATAAPPPREAAVDVKGATDAPREEASAPQGAPSPPGAEEASAPAPITPRAEKAGAPSVADGAGGTTDAGAGPPDAAGTSKGVASDGKIILNLAAEADLRKLPGVGHKRAQAILALRTQMKKFTRVEDLLKVKGIGRRALSRLRPLMRVD